MAFRPAIPHKKVDSCHSSPVCHCSTQGLAAKCFTVRLACLRYTASVRPEPGSNSQKKLNRFRHSYHSSNDKNLEKYYPADNISLLLLYLLTSLDILTVVTCLRKCLFNRPYSKDKSLTENPNRYAYSSTTFQSPPLAIPRKYFYLAIYLSTCHAGPDPASRNCHSCEGRNPSIHCHSDRSGGISLHPMSFPTSESPGRPCSGIYINPQIYSVMPDLIRHPETVIPAKEGRWSPKGEIHPGTIIVIPDSIGNPSPSGGLLVGNPARRFPIGPHPASNTTPYQDYKKVRL